jgi:hypothetical protein
MHEEPESARTFRVYATLAALPVFWTAVLVLLAAVLPEKIRSQAGLDMTLALGGAVPMLIVSGLMLELAFAARKRDES